MKDAQVQNRIKILYKKNELKNKWREDQKKQKELEVRIFYILDKTHTNIIYFRI